MRFAQTLRALILVGGLAVVLALLLGWLWATPELDQRLFFGIWRTRAFLALCALLALAVVAALAAFDRRRAFRVVAVCVGAVAVLAVLEIPAALGLVDYSRAFQGGEGGAGAKAVPHLEVRGEAPQDLAHAWHYPLPWLPFEFKADRRGYRNAPDREDADVYLLGDSILVAGLVPWEQTLTHRIEAASGLRTMNIALIGVGAERQLRMLLDARVPLADRLVLHFVFEGNDLGDLKVERQGGAPERPGLAQRSLLANLLAWLQRKSDPRRLAMERRTGDLAGRQVLFHWTDISFRGLEEEIPAFLEACARIRAAVHERGGRHAVVYVPAKIRVLGPLCTWPAESSLRGHEAHLNPLRERLLADARARGVPVLDLSEPLAEAARAGRTPYFLADTHLDPVGHEVAAQAILAWPEFQRLTRRVR